MIDTLVEIAPKHKVKLSVPLLTSYLIRGLKYQDIARICNISRQAVRSYVLTHYNDFIGLIDTTDNIEALKSKYVASKAKDELLDIFDTCQDFTKRDLIPLTAVSDRHTQQYRLLSDKSTSNVSVDTIDTRVKDRNNKLLEVEAKIKQLTGDV